MSIDLNIPLTPPELEFLPRCCMMLLHTLKCHSYKNQYHIISSVSFFFKHHLLLQYISVSCFHFDTFHKKFMSLSILIKCFGLCMKNIAGKRIGAQHWKIKAGNADSATLIPPNLDDIGKYAMTKKITPKMVTPQKLIIFSLFLELLNFFFVAFWWGFTTNSNMSMAELSSLFWPVIFPK